SADVAHDRAPDPGRGDPAGASARLRDRADRRLAGALLVVRQPAERRAGGDGDALLRVRLLGLAEALDAEQHRDRRRGRRAAAGDWLGGRARRPEPAGPLDVRDRVLLDPAALLGAVAADQAAVRARAGADAADRARRRRDA